MWKSIYQLYSNIHLQRVCKSCCSAHRLKLWGLLEHAVTPARHLTLSSLTSTSVPPTNSSSSPPILCVEEMLGNPEMEHATEALYKGVIGQDRASLARAITLVESSNVSRQRQAQLLLTCVLQHMKEENAKSPGSLQSFRIGKKQ